MAGLVPAIHVLLASKKDARDKRGHDDEDCKKRYACDQNDGMLVNHRAGDQTHV
jgi:hypothetical protein